MAGPAGLVTVYHLSPSNTPQSQQTPQEFVAALNSVLGQYKPTPESLIDCSDQCMTQFFQGLHYSYENGSNLPLIRSRFELFNKTIEAGKELTVDSKNYIKSNLKDPLITILQNELAVAYSNQFSNTTPDSWETALKKDIDDLCSLDNPGNPQKFKTDLTNKVLKVYTKKFEKKPPTPIVSKEMIDPAILQQLSQHFSQNPQHSGLSLAVLPANSLAQVPTFPPAAEDLMDTTQDEVSNPPGKESIQLMESTLKNLKW